MATTATPNRPRRRAAGAQQPRVSSRERGRTGTEEDGGRDQQYDLLTAALIGATIGAGLTFMLRRGPGGSRPVSPVLRGLGKGAKLAGKLGGQGARWAAHQGEELWDRVPRDEIRGHVSDYMGRAREAIDDAVEAELKDLRRAIRRQRKRLGV